MAATPAKPLARGVNGRLHAIVQVAKRNLFHPFAVLHKRRIVERSCGRLQECGRLWKNCERTHNARLQFDLLNFLVLPL